MQRYLRIALLAFIYLVSNVSHAKFRIKYDRPKIDDYQPIFNYLKSNHKVIMGETISYLNGLYSSLNTVEIIVMECGRVDSRYNMEERKIYICYESIWNKVMVMKSEHPEENVSNLIRDSALFTLWHEVGHAMIDELALVDVHDITTNESLADEFAVLSLLWKKESNPEHTIVLNAEYFRIKEKQNKMILSIKKTSNQDKQLSPRHQRLISILIGYKPKLYTIQMGKLLGCRIDVELIRTFYLERTAFWENQLQRMSKRNFRTDTM